MLQACRLMLVPSLHPHQTMGTKEPERPTVLRSREREGADGMDRITLLARPLVPIRPGRNAVSSTRRGLIGYWLLLG